MPESVLDASALVALVRREPGWEAVRPHLARPLVSAVNLAETAQVLRRLGVPWPEVRSVLAGLVPASVPFDEEQAFLAAELHERTRHAGLSFGDCACLALAASRDLTAVTAERGWALLDVGVRVELIR